MNQPEEETQEFETVARVGDIPENKGKAFEWRDRVVAIFNLGGEYSAIDDMCPHMGASLSAGHVEDCVVHCPWHAWRFDVRDGSWCDNPRVKIDAFQVRLVGDEIQLAIPKPKSELEDPKSNGEEEGLEESI